MLVFEETEKLEYWGKTSLTREYGTNKLNPLIVSNPGIDPGPHCWKASALTTVPAL